MSFRWSTSSRWFGRCRASWTFSASCISRGALRRTRKLQSARPPGQVSSSVPSAIWPRSRRSRLESCSGHLVRWTHRPVSGGRTSNERHGRPAADTAISRATARRGPRRRSGSRPSPRRSLRPGAGTTGSAAPRGSPRPRGRVRIGDNRARAGLARLRWFDDQPGARCGATRRPFSNWSANTGTTTTGTPAANAPNTVPDPPWQTTRSASSRTRAWSTHASTWTLAGTSVKLGAVELATHGQQHAGVEGRTARNAIR